MLKRVLKWIRSKTDRIVLNLRKIVGGLQNLRVTKIEDLLRGAKNGNAFRCA